jgi:hypothetical protein
MEQMILCKEKFLMCKAGLSALAIFLLKFLLHASFILLPRIASFASIRPFRSGAGRADEHASLLIISWISDSCWASRMATAAFSLSRAFEYAMQRYNCSWQ